MTDEEKAEEILQTKGSMTFCAKGCGYTEKVKELIAIGLAEGRKETESHLLENWCRNEDDYCPHLKQLEKENAELKAKVLSLESSLENENAINTDFNNQISKLEEQVENMKCCGNCKHWIENIIDDNSVFLCDKGGCDNVEKWELC